MPVVIVMLAMAYFEWATIAAVTAFFVLLKVLALRKKKNLELRYDR